MTAQKKEFAGVVARAVVELSRDIESLRGDLKVWSPALLGICVRGTPALASGARECVCSVSVARELSSPLLRVKI